MYDVDRKTAAKLLKMSLRTVDRYISQKRLSTKKYNGKIWLDKNEIKKLKQLNRVDSANSKMSIDKEGIIEVDMSIDNDNSVYRQQPINSHKRDDEVYRKLFEELQEELKYKQKMLEGANYRVGQLESNIKEMVPLIDYKRDLRIKQAEKEMIEKDLTNQKVEKQQLQIILKEEHLNKKVYLIILLILLILQPLWLLFPL